MSTAIVTTTAIIKQINDITALHQADFASTFAAHGFKREGPLHDRTLESDERLTRHEEFLTERILKVQADAVEYEARGEIQAAAGVYVNGRPLLEELKLLREQGLKVLDLLDRNDVVLPLIDSLRSEDRAVREAAQESVRHMTNRNCLRLFCDTALRDDDRDVTRAAADALRVSSPLHPAVLEWLCEVGVKDDDARVRDRSAYVLHAAPLEARDTLIALASSDPDATVRWNATRGLRASDCVEARETLCSVLKTDKDATVRRGAAAGLAGASDFEAICALCDHGLKDEAEDVRQMAASSLRNSRHGRAIKALCDFGLKDQSPHVREKSAEALWECKSSEAVQALSDALKDESSKVSTAVARTLLSTKEPAALRALCDQGVKGALPEMAMLRMVGIEGRQDAYIVDALRRGLRHKNILVRTCAASALAGAQDRAVVQGLRRLVKDQYPAVRKAAAEALGGTADIKAIRALQRGAANDNDPEVRQACAEAFERCPETEVVSWWPWRTR